ncbi:MAG: YeiH family protein, partial [Rhabdochlamydiaceae bacterium]
IPERYSSGLQFSSRWFLRMGIVLYGFNFSYILWFQPGASWIFAIGLLAVCIPLVVSYFIGSALHLSRNSSVLVGVGTGVCGISAIVATQQATKSDEESAGVALATILVFGTLVLFVYPPLAHILSLNTTVYGVWTGATTLDLPQLVAAALQGGGQASLVAGLWVKSIRIGLLAPVIFVLVVLTANNFKGKVEQKSSGRIGTAFRAFPLFILAFFVVILFNTIFPLPGWISSPIATGRGEFLSLNIANLLLTTAIISICFRVKRQVISKTGGRILFTGGVSWLIQSLIALWLAGNVPIPHVS